MSERREWWIFNRQEPIEAFANSAAASIRELALGYKPIHVREVLSGEVDRIAELQSQLAALRDAATEVVDEWETSGVNDPTGGLMLFFDKIEALEKLLEKRTNRKRGER